MMCEWVKAEMKAGILKDFGAYSDTSGGYGIREEESEEALYRNLMKYVPYLTMETKLVISIDLNIESLKKAAAALKG